MGENMQGWVKLGAVALALGCFVGAYLLPESQAVLSEAGVGLLVAAGVAHKVLPSATK